MRQKTPAQLESQAHSFNKTYYVGDKVRILKDDGQSEIVTVRAPASVLGGHTAVGWFNEISGAYSLDRVIDL